MKDTFYFSHDYNARNDAKIKNLIRKHGINGYGIFWAIVEDLYNNANALPTDYESIAYDLRSDAETVKSIISDFDLFVFDGNNFGSVSIEKRLNERNEKSKNARLAAESRWNKVKEDANAMQTHSNRNAIKERKGKEIKDIKENDITARKLKFSQTLEPFLSVYGKNMLNDFYLYWTEVNPSETKFRKENEKFWDLKRRLETWNKRQKIEPITEPKTTVKKL